MSVTFAETTPALPAAEVARSVAFYGVDALYELLLGFYEERAS